MWVSWICLFLLSYPQTDFTIATVNGPKTFHIGLNVYVFTGSWSCWAFAWAFGKASVFKYISDDYPQNIGTISGIVGLAGGMGGFVLPIMFGALMDLDRHPLQRLHADVRRGLGLADLDVLTEVRRTQVMGGNAAASPCLDGQVTLHTPILPQGNTMATPNLRPPPMAPGCRAGQPENTVILERQGDAVAMANTGPHHPADPGLRRLVPGLEPWSLACRSSVSSSRRAAVLAGRHAPALAGGTLRSCTSFMAPHVRRAPVVSLSTA